MEDLLAKSLLQLGTIAAAVWSAAQVAKAIWPRTNQLLVALVCGPVFAIGAYAAGYFPAALGVAGTPGRAWFTAAFAGLIATLTAKFFNDLVFNKLRDLLGGAKNGQAP